ncbi:PREDICTED: protein quaking [Bison bison bison]|uniref:KH domain-containing RNA-binding protein QKI n=4 Tax=Boreoeutheria TaxID=1437010 RepID=A0A6P3H7D5_BISBB|nr:PREDICTED: protein quaking [Bison bison bison]
MTAESTFLSFCLGKRAPSGSFKFTFGVAGTGSRGARKGEDEASKSLQQGFVGGELRRARTSEDLRSGRLEEGSTEVGRRGRAGVSPSGDVSVAARGKATTTKGIMCLLNNVIKSKIEIRESEKAMCVNVCRLITASCCTVAAVSDSLRPRGLQHTRLLCPSPSPGVCPEISRVRKDMYNDTLNGSTEKRSAELPDAVGPIVQLQEKLYVPVKEYPDFNFVGRILGPRGLTAKQLEAETGCKIMVRGKGSMRDKKKEEQNRGKPNWEHLNEDLHVLITVEDAQNRAEIKLKRAVEEVKKLLVPAAEGEDSLKKMQLMELAILNGTYRDANIKSPTAQAAPRIITGPAPVLPPAALRTPTPAGPTIMPLIRQIQTAVMPNGTPHPTAAIVPPGPEAGLIYTPYEYPYTLAPATSILEYPIEPSGVLGAVATKVRRHDMRVHPYQRIVTADRAATGN